MQNNEESKAWWSFDAKKAYDKRLATINKFRSPKTMADEILWLLQWVIQPLLMLYCIILSFASYQAFFEHNFSPTIAICGALLLCIVIEFGKIKLGSYVFQKPFLQGWHGIRTSFADAAIWIGAFAFAFVAFFMSITNSTDGAKQLALLRGHEKHNEQFQPNTAEIDAQINAINGRVAQNQDIKWKGVVTYQAQKAISSDSKSTATLLQTKQELIAQQRADYEARQKANAHYSELGSEILLVSGGRVEYLQIITLFLIAACMSVLGGMVDSSEKQATKQHQQVFQQSAAQGQQYSTNDGRPKIGFTWESYGSDKQRTVSQPTFTVSQQTQPNSTLGSDAVLKVCKKALQSDMPNFKRQDVKKKSVSERINAALDACFNEMNNPDFCPSMPVAADFYRLCVEDVFPQLNEKGWPYERDTFFLKRLLAVIPKVGQV